MDFCISCSRVHLLSLQGIWVLDERDGFLLEKGMSLMGGLSVFKDVGRTFCPVIDAVFYKDFLLENKNTFLVVEIFL